MADKIPIPESIPEPIPVLISISPIHQKVRAAYRIPVLGANISSITYKIVVAIGLWEEGPKNARILIPYFMVYDKDTCSLQEAQGLSGFLNFEGI